MARKGENIFHRKDGRWEARYVKEQDCFGKKTYGFIYGKSYQEVKNKRNLLLLDLKKNIKITKNNPKKFNLCIDEWLKFQYKKLKRSTYTYYLNIINKHIRPTFGELYLEQITEKTVNYYIQNKIESSNICLSTIMQTTIILNSILGFFEKKVFVKVPKAKKKRIDILTDMESLKLSNYLLSKIDGYSLGILASLHTGIRIGEVCALRWKDINLEDELLTIRHTVSRIKNLDSNKSKTILILDSAKTNNSVRVIPIDKILLQVLKKYKLSSNSEDHFVITNSKKIVDPRTFYNHYKKILKCCGIESHTYHAIRHTFATKCCKLGLDLKSLSELLGHASVKTTLAIYVHSDIETKKKFLNKVFTNF